MITRRPWTAALFLAPGLLLYLALVIYPLIQGAQLSLTNSTVGNAGDFIGLANYTELIRDPDVISAVAVTVSYAIAVVIVQNALGLALARALYQRIRARRVVSLLVILPMLMSAVMAAFIWSYLLSPSGSINAVLNAVGLHSVAHIWLGDPSTALWSIALVNVWQFAGYSCAIFLAGYLGFSSELMDAAQVDGATGWRRFVSVEWPLLAPALTVNVTLTLIGALKIFDLPLVLTNGGPAGSTTTLSILIFRSTFGGQSKFGYGSAIAILLLVIVVLVAATTQTLLRRREMRI